MATQAAHGRRTPVTGRRSLEKDSLEQAARAGKGGHLEQVVQHQVHTPGTREGLGRLGFQG